MFDWLHLDPQSGAVTICNRSVETKSVQVADAHSGPIHGHPNASRNGQNGFKRPNRHEKARSRTERIIAAIRLKPSTTGQLHKSGFGSINNIDHSLRTLLRDRRVHRINHGELVYY